MVGMLDTPRLWFAWYPVRLANPEWSGRGSAMKQIRWVWMQGVFRRKSGRKTYYTIYPG